MLQYFIYMGNAMLLLYIWEILCYYYRYGKHYYYRSKKRYVTVIDLKHVMLLLEIWNNLLL